MNLLSTLIFATAVAAIPLSANFDLDLRGKVVEGPDDKKTIAPSKAVHLPIVGQTKILISDLKSVSSSHPLNRLQSLGLTGQTLTAPQKQLLQDWSLEGTNLEHSELLSYFKDRVPAGIVLMDQMGSRRVISSGRSPIVPADDHEFFSPHKQIFGNKNKVENGSLWATSEAQTQLEYVFVSSDAFMTSVAEERAVQTLATGGRNAAVTTKQPSAIDDLKTNQSVPPKAITPRDAISVPSTALLPDNAFTIHSFAPGFSDNRAVRMIPGLAALDFLDALQGPDYSLDNYNPTVPAEVYKFNSRLLTLGHQGLLVLKITNGTLQNQAGFDFTVFENVFVRPPRAGGAFQEFARIGVSMEAEESKVTWFDCDPLSSKVLGCAGVVPTDLGGDEFDLSQIGVSRARYIWIKDMGFNKNTPGSGQNPWPTEGADIDNVRLIHAYQD